MKNVFIYLLYSVNFINSQTLLKEKSIAQRFQNSVAILSTLYSITAININKTRERGGGENKVNLYLKLHEKTLK